MVTETRFTVFNTNVPNQLYYTICFTFHSNINAINVTIYRSIKLDYEQFYILYE